mgnify:CR=1 FL=1
MKHRKAVTAFERKTSTLSKTITRVLQRGKTVSKDEGDDTQKTPGQNPDQPPQGFNPETPEEMVVELSQLMIDDIMEDGIHRPLELESYLEKREKASSNDILEDKRNQPQEFEISSKEKESDPTIEILEDCSRSQPKEFDISFNIGGRDPTVGVSEDSGHKPQESGISLDKREK